MALSEVEKAYIAGLIDGEGCIYIDRYKDKRNKSGNFSYTLRVKINNTFYGMIEWLDERTVGVYKSNSFKCKGQEYDDWRKNRKPVFEWKLSGMNGIKLLRDVYPYLVIKKKQAEQAFKFEETYCGKNFSETRQFAPIIPELMEKKEMIYQKFRKLNKTGVK